MHCNKLSHNKSGKCAAIQAAANLQHSVAVLEYHPNIEIKTFLLLCALWGHNPLCNNNNPMKMLMTTKYSALFPSIKR